MDNADTDASVSACECVCLRIGGLGGSEGVRVCVCLRMDEWGGSEGVHTPVSSSDVAERVHTAARTQPATVYPGCRSRRPVHPIGQSPGFLIMMIMIKKTSRAPNLVWARSGSQ